MDVRSVLVAVGAGLTTALISGVIVIEALPFEFSAIVGLPAGLLAGVTVAIGVRRNYRRVGEVSRAGLDGGAWFGYTVFLLLAVAYVDPVGLEGIFSIPTVVGVAIGMAVIVALFSWRRARPSNSLPETH